MISTEKYPLPDDWEIKYDFVTKRNFFVNHKTKTTTWEDPRLKIYGKEIEQSRGITPDDFLENDEDMHRILKETENEFEIENEVTRIAKKFPEFTRTHIREVYDKSKRNASNTEVLLRQEARKTTDTTARSSDIGCKTGGHPRFCLSERGKYDAPESSNQRIKFQLRGEFSQVDNRIIDRVLASVDWDLEQARAVLRENYKTKDSDAILIPSKEKTKKYKDTPKELENFKYLVRLESGSEKYSSNESLNSGSSPRKTRAVGANPKNYSGSQYAKMKNDFN